MFVVRFCSQDKVPVLHLAFKKNSGHFFTFGQFLLGFCELFACIFTLESLCFYYFCSTLIIMFCYCGQIMIC